MMNITPVSNEAPIFQKKAPANDKRIKVLILSENPFKRAEYDQCLGKKYGVNLSYKKPPEVITDEVVRNILSEMNPSPNYIIREESSLVNDLTRETLSGLEVVNNPEKAPRLVVNHAKLDVWVPKWNKENGQLIELKRDHYAHQVKGYIDPKRKSQRNDSVFGWDHLFVNAQTGKTNQDTIYSNWGKNSARQLVLGDFITNYLFYREPQRLTYHTDLQPKDGVEFSHNMSVGHFMGHNKFLTNENISYWGLDSIRDHILNEGVFFRAATSRPLKNYFSPPFGGVPVTPKKSDVEETVFMMHDLNHHNVPDLIFDVEGTKEMSHVYSGWRMMSEAITLVVADMLYADTLVKTNPDYASKVDSRIYPLFQALVLKGTRDEIIRKLLWANIQYAILGDDSEWRALLKPGQESKLDAYKNHFEKFFVGDHVWTNANFKNMSNMADYYKKWIDVVGKEQYKRANLPFVSEVAEKLKARGADLSSFKSVIQYTFDEIFETRILSKLNQVPEKLDEEERLKRAFHRYMIGQMSFYLRYQELPGFPDKTKAIADRLKNSTLDEKERAEIYDQYVNDVRYVWGMGLITSASADNYAQMHPIFPPVYINYSRQESKTIAEEVDKIYGAPSLENVGAVQINTSDDENLAEYAQYLAPRQVVSNPMVLKSPLDTPLTVIQYKASQLDKVLVDDEYLEVEDKVVRLNQTGEELSGKECTYVSRVAIKVDQLVRVYEGKVKGTLVSSRGNIFQPEGKDTARHLAIEKLKKDERFATLPLLKEWSGEFQNTKRVKI